MKKISAVFFVIFLIGISAFLLNIYRQAVPPKYFYLFIAFVGVFIVAEIFFYKFVRKRFADNPLIIKLFDLFSFIVLGLLLYLFAIYIYPAK
jgi:hypothetical protein